MHDTLSEAGIYIYIYTWIRVVGFKMDSGVSRWIRGVSRWARVGGFKMGSGESQYGFEGFTMGPGRSRSVREFQYRSGRSKKRGL